MFQHRRRTLFWWTLGTAIALTVPPLAAQESLPYNRLGRAAVEYRDKAIHVVAAYYYSQRNHDSRWLYIQSGVTTRHNNVIHRDAIVLRTPQAREIPLATQRRVGEDTVTVENLLQNASVVSHDITSYFVQQNRFEEMRLFRLPFGDVVSDSFVVDRDRVAIGPLFFESPTGAWEDGKYTLVVRHKTGAAELPITLE